MLQYCISACGAFAQAQSQLQVVLSGAGRAVEPPALFDRRWADDASPGPVSQLPTALPSPDPLCDFDAGAWHIDDIDSGGLSGNRMLD